MPPARTSIILLVTILLGAGPACGRDEPSGRREPTPFASRADFKAGEIRTINPAERPEAQQKASEEAPGVIALLNGFYSTAFLDRSKWTGGSHSELAGFFTPDARTHIAPSLGALALADLAPQLRGLNPSKQEASRISFYVEDDLSIPIGVATAVFEAKATPVRGRAPVAILHNANFWVVKEAGSYKIYAYSVELKADSQTRSAASGTPTGESPR